MRDKKFILIAQILLEFGLMGLQGQTTGIFTDSRDGKVYKTVKIGEQVWMAENLAYKSSSGNCWAYDFDDSYIAVYGYLYDWETAKKASPTGWHLPSDAEWTKLTDYLGGEDVAGGKLKETGTTHWNSPNNGAINKTGFTALPGGFRGSYGFELIGRHGYWWTATEDSPSSAWFRYLFYDFSDVTRDFNDKEIGYSVRCLKD